MSTQAERPQRPMPTPSVLSAEFWVATRDHRLMCQRCGTCGRYEWTPQDVCSWCLTETLGWAEVSGKGRLYSYSVVHRSQSPALAAPYIVAIVELLEGPRIVTNLVDVGERDVEIGMPVCVRFLDAGEVALYQFTPDSAPWYGR